MINLITVTINLFFEKTIGFKTPFSDDNLTIFISLPPDKSVVTKLLSAEWVRHLADTAKDRFWDFTIYEHNSIDRT